MAKLESIHKLWRRKQLSNSRLHAFILASRSKTRSLSAIPYQRCGIPRELAVWRSGVRAPSGPPTLNIDPTGVCDTGGIFQFRRYRSKNVSALQTALQTRSKREVESTSMKRIAKPNPKMIHILVQIEARMRPGARTADPITDDFRHCSVEVRGSINRREVHRSHSHQAERNPH